jgi:hypothetical protein
MLVALLVGGVVLVPALIYLYVLFQRAHPEHPGSVEGSVPASPPAWRSAER